jgi:membrane protease YdiL (CAAX protease family)
MVPLQKEKPMDTPLSPLEVKPATAEPTARRVSWLNIGLYIILAFGISWLIWLVLRSLGVPFAIRAAVGMFGPALAAGLVRLIRHEGFNDAGLRLVTCGNRRGWWMYLAAYLVIPVLILAGILVALLSGYQHWALNAHLQALAQTIVASLRAQGQQLPSGMAPEQLALISIISQMALAFTLALPFNMIFTFGEEFGWRGYLLPKLAPLGGIGAAIITGVVWGLWHAPLILLDSYNYPGHPWLGVLMMIVLTVSLSCIFAWLRFRSGSVWPSTLAHATLNAQAGFGTLVLSQGDSLLAAPIGLLGLIPMIALALWLAFTGKLRPENAL